MAEWQKVFETGSGVRAEIVKSVLEQNGVKVIILNKKESVYQLHGNYELMVSPLQFDEAINIIEDEISF